MKLFIKLQEIFLKFPSTLTMQQQALMLNNLLILIKSSASSSNEHFHQIAPKVSVDRHGILWMLTNFRFSFLTSKLHKSKFLDALKFKSRLEWNFILFSVDGKFTNVEGTGLSNYVVSNVNADIFRGRVSFSVKYPELTIRGQQQMSGLYSGAPFTTSGDFNIVVRGKTVEINKWKCRILVNNFNNLFRCGSSTIIPSWFLPKTTINYQQWSNFSGISFCIFHRTWTCFNGTTNQRCNLGWSSAIHCRKSKLRECANY